MKAAVPVSCIGLLFWFASWIPRAAATIHTSPVVIQGSRIIQTTQYPLDSYRLFKSDGKGNAVPIPFQIDEINSWGDYVLPEGGSVTAKTGNGVFDIQDELSFMGDDVGPVKMPDHWGQGKPALTFEIILTSTIKNPAGDQQGAVYLAVFFKNPPPLSDRKYVNFDISQAEVTTSRYRYGFDKKNWLVARRIDMRIPTPQGDMTSKPDWTPLIESTTFYMRADLKYFLTINASHRSINSELEAFKVGPIRSITRISFHYSFLKLNFELGMYTEVSFFPNAVYLPAILYNPLEGKKALNGGSGFYYGMAMRDNPGDLNIKTNMPPYQINSHKGIFKSESASENNYWITASAKDRMLYVELTPSVDMKLRGAIPHLYQEHILGRDAVSRNREEPGPLGEGPVNMALYFDMTRFNEGEHSMSFRLYFENLNAPDRLAGFKNLATWLVESRRLP